MLWPKFKQLRMFTRGEREEIYQLARYEVTSFPREPAPEVAQQSGTALEVAESQVPFSQWEDVEDGVGEGWDEVDKYLKYKSTMSDDRDILEFWKQNGKHFPMVARLAKKILCVPASSVSCESAFSVSGRALENRRTFLGTASVNALLFLNSNFE